MDDLVSRFKRMELIELKNIFSLTTWYLNPTLQPLIAEYFEINHDDKNDEWLEERKAFIQIIAELLEEGAIHLGTERGEGYNDTKRAKTVGGKLEWVQVPNTVVIHHTSSTPDTTYKMINALHLMRLYVPLYKSKYEYFYGSDEKPLPIESGHYSLEVQPIHQTFVGYHHLVFSNSLGQVSYIQSLKNEYVGFHAGNLATNIESYGIAIVDDLLESEPSEEVLNEITRIIKDKVDTGVLTPDFKLIGHQDVIAPSGTKVETVCPGNKWGIWKPRLEAKLRSSID